MVITSSRAEDFGTASRSIRLRPSASAARVARRLVRDLCANWRLPDDLINDAVLVTSQLVTSSVKQAGMALEVVVEVDAATVTVRVQDDMGTACASPVRSRWRGARRSQEIVARRSTAWGYYRCGAGRETWASFRADPEYITI